MAKRSKIWTVQELKKMSVKDVRRMYSKMSYTARQRIAQVEKMGGKLYGESESTALSGMQGITKEQLIKKVAFLSRFLSGNTTWARYEESRKHELETLHQSGFTFVNRENLEAFRQFMAMMREAGALDGTYDSDEIAESFEDVEKKNLDVEQVAQAFEDFGGDFKTFKEFSDVWL